MQTSEFDYHLSTELIAQEPLPERSNSRMMVIHRDTAAFEHRRISDIVEYLSPADLLVVNNTKVFPARILGQKVGTGGQVELLLLEERERNVWECLCRASRRPQPGTQFSMAKGRIEAEIVSTGQAGKVVARLSSSEPLMDVLEAEGFAPVPPYIRREREASSMTRMDKERYQTVYAESTGAVAAPTAGLHFTPNLLNSLHAKGVGQAAITLHVGPGTFKPVKADIVDDHRMDAERYIIGAEAAEAINSKKLQGGRVVAVGSTTVRTLETVWGEQGRIVPCEGRSSLFIRPPYKFGVVDAMLTNFHLPKSTLIMMVSAFAGKDLTFAAYGAAIEEGYRFYSYGDCMLIV